MYLSVICYAFLLFSISLLVHVIIWRFHHPKHQSIVLFSIFLITPGLGLIVVYGANNLSPYLEPGIIGAFSRFGALELFEIYLLESALSLAYMFSYPAAQARCPTFAILLVIKSSMPRGASRDEILSCFSHEAVMGPRVHDLVNETLVERKNGWLELSRKGRILITGFKIFRRLSALPMGRG